MAQVASGLSVFCLSDQQIFNYCEMTIWPCLFMNILYICVKGAQYIVLFDQRGFALKTVLVADSANITHFVLERILGKEGCSVFYVKYPRDLVTQIRKVRPDMLFLEPEISGGRGKQIVDFLAKQVDIAVPIILITRITDSTRYNMDSWPGIHRVLRKPLNSEKVLEAVSSLPAVERISQRDLADQNKASMG